MIARSTLSGGSADFIQRHSCFLGFCYLLRVQKADDPLSITCGSQEIHSSGESLPGWVMVWFKWDKSADTLIPLDFPRRRAEAWEAMAMVVRHLRPTDKTASLRLRYSCEPGIVCSYIMVLRATPSNAISRLHSPSCIAVREGITNESSCHHNAAETGTKGAAVDQSLALDSFHSPITLKHFSAPRALAKRFASAL